MSLAVLADHLASKGRNGDTMLVHMTPEEVHGLHALALAHGGQLTINPETGLPEANFLKKMLPMIAGMALNFIAPGVGTAISGALGITGAAAGAIGTGLAVGGITGLATGSLKQGIMAGLGAYGGASLAGGLQAAGLAGAQEAALSKIPAAELQQVVDYSGLTEQGYKNLIAEQATRDYLGKGAMDRFTSGLGALGSEAGRTAALQGVGGASGLMRAGFMGMAGADAFGQPQTATQMPGSGFKYPPRIRPMSWNQYTGQLEQLPMFSAINQAGLTPAPAPAPAQPEAQPSGGYNTGGIVALAAGGAPPGMTGSVAEQNVLNTKGWQSRSGLTGIEGLNSNINMWFNEFPQAKETDIRNAMQQYGLNDADIMRATGKSVGELAYKPPAPAPAPAPAPIVSGPSTPGTTGPSATFGGNTIIPEYVAPQPQTNVTLGEAFQPTPQTMEQVRTNYEQGGGSTRMPTITDIKPGERTYTQNAVVDLLTGYLQSNPNAQYSEVQKFAQSKGIPEMQARAAYNEFRFSTMTGGTKQAYDYLMGRAPYSAKPYVPGGGPIMKPYAEAVGLAAPGSTGGGGYFGRQTIPTSPTQQNAQGTTSTTGTTAGIAGLTTKPTADTLRSTFDQSIFSKTPLEKAAYYNSLLAKGYDDATIRAAINAPLDENWLALRELAASLKTGAPTAGGGSTSGGGTTFLGGSNTRMDGTKKPDNTSVDTTRSTDAETVGGVVVGNNVIDPISGGVLGVVTANVDQGTNGIIQGDVVVDPITGKIIGYSQDAGLTGQLFNKKIGEEPAPIESRYVPS
ncbi:MAG: hypothetical protein RI949_275, partial [Pseudomonadota bacterium]